MINKERVMLSMLHIAHELRDDEERGHTMTEEQCHLDYMLYDYEACDALDTDDEKFLDELKRFAKALSAYVEE